MHFPKTLYLDDVHSVLMILEQTLLPGEENMSLFIMRKRLLRQYAF